MSWYLKWQSGAEPSVGSTTTSASYAMRRRYGVPASRPGIFGDSIVTSNSGPMNSDEASFLPDLSHVPRSFLADEAPAPCVTKRENIDLRIGPRDELNPNSELDGGGGARCRSDAGSPQTHHAAPSFKGALESRRGASAARHGRPVWHTRRQARPPAHMPGCRSGLLPRPVRRPTRAFRPIR